MQQIVRAVVVSSVLVLAGCSMGPTQTTSVPAGPVLATPTDQPAPGGIGTDTQVATNTTAVTADSPGTLDPAAFIDAGVIGKLSPKEKALAASTQLNALTFGRPGAPRTWSGDHGGSGSVTVGPFVQVNNLVCRDFTHTVTLAGGTFTKKGTACKDQTGAWSVS